MRSERSFPSGDIGPDRILRVHVACGGICLAVLAALLARILGGQ